MILAPLLAEQDIALHNALLQTVAYADIFEYALDATQIWRYLIGIHANQAQVIQGIQQAADEQTLVMAGDYLMLPKRHALAALRHERAIRALHMWQRAYYYGNLIARIPFVRMVAVTGALAVDNVTAGADIDFLIVTQPGRVWLTRALVIGLVRFAAVRGDTICPNYLLSEHALTIPDQSLYTAHELAQMVPLAGLGVYQRMRQHNPWVGQFLPNSAGTPRTFAQAQIVTQSGSHQAERLLNGRIGDQIESWEMQRKISKIRREYGISTEAAFGPEWCKGHFENHGSRVMQAYQQRLEELGIRDW